MPNTEYTIAVLPFANRSPDPEQGYFCDGITEEIINALAGIEPLRVTSRTSSFQFKNPKRPLREIARELGVAVILEGSVRLRGKTVRISAQLVQAEEDFYFWSESWDRQLDDIFAIQDEISLLIAEKLREQFGHFEIEEQLVRPQTESLDAYACSLKARYYFNKWNPEDAEQARQLYEKALELAPRHTESLVGLADVYGFLATTEFMDRTEGWQKAAAYTQQALQLNQHSPGAHYQLANLAFFTDCDFRQACIHTQSALDIRPNYPEARQFMAFLHTLEGQPELASRHLSHALMIDPLSPETLFYKAYFDYRQRDYAGALRQLEHLLRQNPRNLPAYITKCYCLLKLHRYQDALDFLGQVPDEIAVAGDGLGITCLAHTLSGKTEEAGQAFAELQRMADSPHAFQAHSYLFLAYANQHQPDAAFDWLEKAMQWKSSVLLLGFSDPLSEPLWQDPRYARFQKQLYRRSAPSGSKPDKSPLLDEDSAAGFRELLLAYMESDTPYLSPSLSLRELAGRIELHPNKLSWLLNETLQQNFNTFVNRYRVEHFKRLALDPANHHISLLGLAYESGFNSKTVFNTYFKKETGLSPRAYLQQNGSDL